MKDIKAILSAFELSDDDREAIIKEVGENYRSIVEMEKKTSRIKELEEQNEALTKQVGNLEGDGEEVKKLQKQVEDFEAKEAQRKADAEEAAKRDQFRAVFDAAVGEKEFANDIIRDSIFDRAYAKCTETTGLDAKQVIEEMTKDADGVWKNPQQEVAKMPDPAALSSNNDKKKKEDEGTITDFLFGRK